jgi:molybdate transport system substrate-binding protein
MTSAELEVSLVMSGEMKIRRWVLSLCAVLTMLAMGAPLCGCRAHNEETLTISVAASLQDTIVEIESAYQRENPDVVFHNNFGSSGMLAQEIEQGAPVDAFISAGVKPVDQLDAGGLLQPGSRTDLLRNSLVLIAPRGSDLQGFGQLVEKQVRLIALGDPASVPAGQYGKQALDSLHLYEQLKSKIVLGKDVRQVLTYVETGNADAGLVYATDAQISRQVRTVAVAPDASHSPIVYPMAEVKGTHHDAAVRRFTAFLKSAAARAIFERHGFRMA